MDNKVSIINIRRDLTYQLTSLIESLQMFLRNSQNQNIQNMYMQVKINFSIIPKDVKNHHIDKYHKYYITDNKNLFFISPFYS